MKKSSNRIIERILEKTILDKNFVVQDFFVGLTDDPKKSLFLDHKVDKNDGLYVYYEASSTKEAQEAYHELMELDMNGTTITDYKSGKYVYCYHINGQTIECPICNSL